MKDRIQVNIQVSVELKKQIRLEAIRRDMTIQNFITASIHAYCDATPGTGVVAFVPGTEGAADYWQ